MSHLFVPHACVLCRGGLGTAVLSTLAAQRQVSEGTCLARTTSLRVPCHAQNPAHFCARGTQATHQCAREPEPWVPPLGVGFNLTMQGEVVQTLEAGACMPILDCWLRVCGQTQPCSHVSARMPTHLNRSHQARNHTHSKAIHMHMLATHIQKPSHAHAVTCVPSQAAVERAVRVVMGRNRIESTCHLGLEIGK